MSTVLESAPALLPAVQAELNYITPMADRPFTYTHEPPPGEPRTNVRPEPHRVTIRNARALGPDEVSLDTTGFAVIRHRSAVTDFSDEAQIRDTYYPESVEAIRQIPTTRRSCWTGAFR